MSRSGTIKRVLLPSLLILLLLILAFAFLRLRGGTVVQAEGSSGIPERVAAYRQDDSAWAADPLGTSAYTMESSGCLVACIASAVSMETGRALKPGELNQIFTAQGVYDSEGNVQWAALDAASHAIEGSEAVVYPDVSGDDIRQLLAAGHYPIVRVRRRGIGAFHYILIVGSADGGYVCMDPLEDELTRLSQYWDRVYAVRAVHP